MSTTPTSGYQILTIASGTLAGTWGDVTNANFQRVEKALGGSYALNITSPDNGTWASGTRISTWTTPDSESSNSRSKFVCIKDAGSDLGGDPRLKICGTTDSSPVDRIYFFKNDLSGSRSIYIQVHDESSATGGLKIPSACFALVRISNTAVDGLKVENVLHQLETAGIHIAPTTDVPVIDASNSTSGNAVVKIADNLAEAFNFEVGSNKLLWLDTDESEGIGAVRVNASSLSLQNDTSTKRFLIDTSGETNGTDWKLHSSGINLQDASGNNALVLGSSTVGIGSATFSTTTFNSPTIDIDPAADITIKEDDNNSLSVYESSASAANLVLNVDTLGTKRVDIGGASSSTDLRVYGATTLDSGLTVSGSVTLPAFTSTGAQTLNEGEQIAAGKTVKIEKTAGSGVYYEALASNDNANPTLSVGDNAADKNDKLVLRVSSNASSKESALKFNYGGADKDVFHQGNLLFFESTTNWTGTSLNKNTSGTQAHSLGGIPHFVWGALRNVSGSTISGYVDDAEGLIQNSASGNDNEHRRFIQLFWDGTSVGYRTGSNDVRICSASDGSSYVSVDGSASWRLYIRAIRFL